MTSYAQEAAATSKEIRRGWNPTGATECVPRVEGSAGGPPRATEGCPPGAFSNISIQTTLSTGPVHPATHRLGGSRERQVGYLVPKVEPVAAVGNFYDGGGDGSLTLGIPRASAASVAVGTESAGGSQAYSVQRQLREEPPCNAMASAGSVNTRPAAAAPAAPDVPLNGGSGGGGGEPSEAVCGGRLPAVAATGLGTGVPVQERSPGAPVAVGLSASASTATEGIDQPIPVGIQQSAAIPQVVLVGSQQPAAMGMICSTTVGIFPPPAAAVPASATAPAPPAVGIQAPLSDGISSLAAVGIVGQGQWHPGGMAPPSIGAAPSTELPRLAAPATHMPSEQVLATDPVWMEGDERSSSPRSKDNTSNGDNNNGIPPPPTVVTEAGSDSRLNLPMFHNRAAPPTHMPQPSDARIVRRVTSRSKTCNHEEVDGTRCSRRPSFGFPGDRRASRCASHKLEWQEDITSRRCDSEGCTRIPSFRRPGDKGKTRFCAAHKLPGFEDYHKGARHCRTAPAGENACNRNSSFGFKGGRRISCAMHKQIGMINLNTPRCRDPECDLTPYFGLRGATAMFCLKHKLPDMVNVISKRCQDESCDRIPSYNYDIPGAKAIYCNSHKAEGMINVRHPRCADPDCKRQPSFGKAGGTKAVYCASHKEPDMVDVVNNYRKKQTKKRKTKG